MTTYYVKNGGNDGLSGTSDANAWATTNKVNSEFAAGTFDRGDNIYFNKGDSWTITGTASWIRIRNIGGAAGVVTIGAYGTGADPVLDGNGTAGLSVFYVASGASATSSYWTIDGLEIRNTGDPVVSVHDCTNWTIQNCTIHISDDAGIYASNDCTTFLIDANTIYTVTGEGIYLGSSSDASDTTGSGTVSNNTIYDTGNEGIDLKFCTSSITVTANRITNCNTSTSGSRTDTGIKLGGQNHVVTYNVVRDMSDRVGIGTAYQGVGYSIDTQSMTIRYNQVDTAGWGILTLGASGDAFDDATIEYNELTNCTYGIYLRYSTGIDLAYNDLCSGSYGIYADAGDPDTSDYNHFGSYLTSNDCYYSGDAKTFTEACADVTLECNSARGKSELSAVSLEDVGLVSYWRMEEASGTRFDETATNNDLADNNTVTRSATHKEGSYSASFANATSEYLSLADGSQTGLDGMSTLTLCCWFYPASYLARHNAMTKSDWSDSGDRSYALLVDKDESSNVFSLRGWVYTGDSADVFGTDSMYTSAWYHIALIYNGTDVRLYLNGVLDESAYNPYTLTGTVVDSTADFMIGAMDNYPTTYLDGLIDAATVFDREIDPWELAYIVENGLLEAVSPSASESASISPSASGSASLSPSASPSPSSSPSASESASPSPSAGFSASASESASASASSPPTLILLHAIEKY